MFHPLSIPFGANMLFNVVKLKPGVELEDVELLLGEMCNVVKNTYGDDGFIGGQVFKYSGFVSEEGSLDGAPRTEPHVAIVTWWESFEQHERSHADAVFKEKFAALAEFCDDTYEIGYEMLWQGEPEKAHAED
jgi:hypothetical protein